MSITLSPAKRHYLEQVSSGLADLSEEDREEVILDLEAHLSELDDDSIEPTLGAPDVFVVEFRHSAGLDDSSPVAGPSLGRKARATLETWSSKLSNFSRWPTVRPVWIWTRGWLIVSVYSGVSENIAFQNFPIPTMNFRTSFGLIAVITATWLSVWLDRQPRHPIRDLATTAYSLVGVYALAIGIFGPVTLTQPHVFEEEPVYYDQLVSPNGNSVDNIYAYDLDGNPVEVLLFDQEGRPLLSLANYVYEEAEFNPGLEALDYGNGLVTFQRDEFGRIIPNLYPLQLLTYDEYGQAVPVPPPSVGFPAVDHEKPTPDPGMVSTTISTNQR